MQQLHQQTKSDSSLMQAILYASGSGYNTTDSIHMSCTKTLCGEFVRNKILQGCVGEYQTHGLLPFGYCSVAMTGILSTFAALTYDRGVRKAVVRRYCTILWATVIISGK